VEDRRAIWTIGLISLAVVLLSDSRCLGHMVEPRPLRPMVRGQEPIDKVASRPIEDSDFDWLRARCGNEASFDSFQSVGRRIYSESAEMGERGRWIVEPTFATPG
jgi:hypothetical protein